MGLISIELVALAGTILGVASHLGYFIHGEHHMQSARIAGCLSLAPLALFLFSSKYLDGYSNVEAGKFAVVAWGSFVAALSSSILVYRAFFHPLRHFPGPFGARLSQIWHVSKIAKDSRNFMLAEQMFSKYGEFVRCVQDLRTAEDTNRELSC